MSAGPPVIAGRYRIEGLIATGGMAEIYVAVELGPKGPLRRVAIKRVLPQLSAKSKFREMFLAEAEIAARCEHANLVRAYAVIEEAGELYLVQEFVDGADVGQVVDRLRRRGEKMQEEYAALIALGVAHGLEYIHSLTSDSGEPLGMVHRDVSPANIMVSRSGEVKILDFGIARQAGRALTEPHELKGKIGYLAPEQIEQENIGPHTDVYGLGLVLYELVTLEPAIRGDTTSELLAAVRNPKIVPAKEVRDDLSEDLAGILNRLLAPNIDSRYLDAHEFEGDLLDYFAARRRPSPSELGEFVESLEIKREIKPWRKTAVLAAERLGRGARPRAPSERGSAIERRRFRFLIPIALAVIAVGSIALMWAGLRLFRTQGPQATSGLGEFAPAAIRVAGVGELLFCEAGNSVVPILPSGETALNYEDVRDRSLKFSGARFASWRYTPRTLRKTAVRLPALPVRVGVDFGAERLAFELDGQFTSVPRSVSFGWHLVWMLDEAGSMEQRLAPFAP